MSQTAPYNVVTQAANCSLPMTFNGGLYYGCAQTVVDNGGAGPCNKWACVMQNRTWAVCLPPYGQRGGKLIYVH